MNLMISKTDFKRDKKHLAFIRQLPCSVCATNYAIDAAHIRFANPCGTGLKPSDEHTVPLCRNHHSEQHLWPAGEEAWWEVRDRDPQAISKTLYCISKKDWPQSQRISTAEEYVRTINGFIK